MIVALLSAFAVLGCSVVATRTSPFRVDPVGPFEPGSADALADTLCGEVTIRTPPPVAEWQLATFTRLRDVEDFLDHLESCRIERREVHTLGNSSFAVRWC